MSGDPVETTPARLEDSYRERKRARWDPTINLGHIISAGVCLVSALTFAIGVYIVINTRVIVLEEAKAYQAQRDLAQDVAVRDKFEDIKSSLSEMKSSINELRRDVREKK